MNAEQQLQDYCRSLAGTTEDVKWGTNLVFSVAEKMYVVFSLDDDPPRLSFKTEPAMFEALTHQDGIIPAPYLARAKWVALESLDALATEEIEDLIGESYRLVFEKLPKKTQRQIRPEG